MRALFFVLLIFTIMAVLSGCSESSVRYIETADQAEPDPEVHILPVVTDKNCKVYQLRKFKLKSTENGDTLEIIKNSESELVIHCTLIK